MQRSGGKESEEMLVKEGRQEMGNGRKAYEEDSVNIHPNSHTYSKILLEIIIYYINNRVCHNLHLI